MVPRLLFRAWRFPRAKPRARRLAWLALIGFLAVMWSGAGEAGRHRETPLFSFALVGDPSDVRTPTRGGFVLEGGGTDIDDSFSWMIGRSGGGDFLVIRTSGTDAYNPYIWELASPEGLRPNSVSTLIFRDRAASTDPFVLDTLRRAEAVWIAGGDQARHVAFWSGTPVARMIENLVKRGVPLGGTSSGLAVLGEFIYSAESENGAPVHLFSESALRDPCQERITLRRDMFRLPLFSGILMDPHFLQESRHGRMATFLSRIVNLGWSGAPRGLGIDAKTALLVEPDGRSKVITHPEHPSGSAILFEMAGPPEVCEAGSRLTVRGIRLQEFHQGETFDLSQWKGARARNRRLSVEDGLVCLDDGPGPVPPSPVSVVATGLVAAQEAPAEGGQ